MEPSGNRQIAGQVRLRAIPPQKKSYFFGDVDSQCDQKYLEPYVRKLLNELEQEHGITHTDAVQKAIDEQRNEGNINFDLPLNPLIPVILGRTDHISSQEILDHVEQELGLSRDANKEIAFIDLCLILGNEGRARKYAERLKSHFDLLNILQQERGKMPDEIMSRTIQKFWFAQNKSNDYKSADLTGLIIRIIGWRESSTLPDVLSELAGKSYIWDALCLAVALTPGKPDYIAAMKEALNQQMTQNSSQKAWVNITQELLKLKNGQIDNMNIKYESVEPVTAYRIFKIHQCMFHKTNPEPLILQLSPAVSLNILNTIIAGFFMTNDPALAEDFAQDAARYLLSRESSAIEATSFEAIIQMAVCIVTAARHNTGLLKPSTMSRFTEDKHDLKEIRQNGMMNYVTSKWMALEMGKKLWKTGNTICLQSIQSVTTALRHLISEPFTNMALFIMGILAAPDSKDHYHQEVKSKIPADVVNIFSYNFDPNPESWRVVSKTNEIVDSEASTPSEVPSRFTGPSFVEQIKMVTPPESVAAENEAVIVADEPIQEETFNVEETEEKSARVQETKPEPAEIVEKTKEEPSTVQEKTSAGEQESKNTASVVDEHPMDSTQSMSSDSVTFPLKLNNSGSFEEKQQDWTAVPKQEVEPEVSNMPCPSDDGLYTEETDTPSANTPAAASTSNSLDQLVKENLPEVPSVVQNPTVESEKPTNVDDPATSFFTGGFESVPAMPPSQPFVSQIGFGSRPAAPRGPAQSFDRPEGNRFPRREGDRFERREGDRFERRDGDRNQRGNYQRGRGRGTSGYQGGDRPPMHRSFH